MNFTILQSHVELHKSTREIAKLLNTSPTNVRYWLKKYNLKTKKAIANTRICPCCEKDLPKDQFYSRRGKEGSSVYCKTCTNEQTLKRQRALKEQAVQYKGGKCSVCDYNKYQGALEFHHLDPNEKDFSIAQARHTTFDKVKAELDKCVLLCSNCHREVHANLIDLAPPRGIEPPDYLPTL